MFKHSFKIISTIDHACSLIHVWKKIHNMEENTLYFSNSAVVKTRR